MTPWNLGKLNWKHIFFNWISKKCVKFQKSFAPYHPHQHPWHFSFCTTTPMHNIFISLYPNVGIFSFFKSIYPGTWIWRKNKIPTFGYREMKMLLPRGGGAEWKVVRWWCGLYGAKIFLEFDTFFWYSI